MVWPETRSVKVPLTAVRLLNRPVSPVITAPLMVPLVSRSFWTTTPLKVARLLPVDCREVTGACNRKVASDCDIAVNYLTSDIDVVLI